MAQITTYTVDPAKRRILTVENMEELGITPDFIQEFLNKKTPELRRIKVDQKGTPVLDSKNQQIPLWPVGVSINDKKFGNFPDPNAAQRGWMGFFEVGSPLFEERSSIIQPTADVLSTRTYDNRANEPRQFSDTIEFSMENSITWTLSATGHANFGGRVAGELQGQMSTTLQTTLTESMSNSLANYLSNTLTQTNTHDNHNHRDNVGTEDISAAATANQSAVTATTNFTSTNSNSASHTGTGTAIGRGELYAELGLALTGTISGTLTTSWKSSSSVSGTISPNTRVETKATQRRQVKQFTYEIPITFDGYIALNYDELVLPIADGNGPPLASTNYTTPSKVIPVNISYLQLVESGKLYRAKGMAETVSALDVNHAIFDTKPLNRDSRQKFGTERPHNL